MQHNFTEAALESIASELSLGLQVKDKTVKHFTIDFIFHHHYSNKEISFIVDTMVSSTDSESMPAICEYLLVFESNDLERPIYRLLFVFFNSGKILL